MAFSTLGSTEHRRLRLGPRSRAASGRGEDLDMFCRLLRAGWAVCISPSICQPRQCEAQWRAAPAFLLYGYGVGSRGAGGKYWRLERRLGLTWRRGAGPAAAEPCGPLSPC